MNSKDYRAISVKILTALQKGSGSLTSHLAQYTDLHDYGLLQETTYGACRWFHALEYLLNQLVSKPLRDKDLDLKSLLIIGFYQLRELSIPDYAVINETVSTASMYGKPWGKSLINGVLRNYLRSQHELEESLNQSSADTRYSHPSWLVDELFKQWPEQAEQILAHNNVRPPMTLRANQRQNSREELLKQLHVASVGAQAGKFSNTAIYLDQPRPLANLPGFGNGQLSVQDEASQLVPALLQLSPGQSVLDACAAPGGKTCHILESECSLTSLLALDRASDRVNKIKDNLTRLHLEATTLCADVNIPSTWWDGKKFDRILLDAPCSATGVVRRHPDIKLLGTPENVLSLQKNQQELLNSLWPCLKKGGLLLYTTCSLLRQENEFIIDEFLQCTDNAKYEGVAADWGVECRYGRQLLTGANDGPDGFFYCLLRKI